MAAVSASMAPPDPTKPGKYPVILSDALRGKPATEIFTGLRYLSSGRAPDMAKLVPSAPNSSSSSFDLSFADDASKGAYAYSGTRATDANQFVMYFDPARQAFVLDRVDSVFSMNVTRTPECSDAEALRRQFDHLDTTVPPVPTGALTTEISSGSRSGSGSVRAAGEEEEEDREEETASIVAGVQTLASMQESTTSKIVSPAKKGKGAAGQGQTAAARKRAEKTAAAQTNKGTAKKETKAKQPAAKKSKAAATATPAAPKAKPPVELLLPEPAPPSPAAQPPTISLPAALPEPSPKRSRRRSSASDESASDDDDDDGGLLVEYPDAPGGAQENLNNSFSPAFQIPQRQWSEFLDDVADADNEDDNDDDIYDRDARRDGHDDGDAEPDADVNELQLPSPVGRSGRAEDEELQQSFEFEYDDDRRDGREGGEGEGEGEGDGDNDAGGTDDLDEDLTAALEAELEAGNESEESEED